VARSRASGSTTPRTPPTSRFAFSKSDMRVGVGYDSHRFADGDGRKLILGGVEIPHPRGLAGHSDADAVAHALTDAILGAAGLGDIGMMFPPTNPRWKNADSLDLLKRAYLRVVEAGLSFVSADITVIMEQPRLAPYVDGLREKLGAARGTLHAGVVFGLTWSANVAGAAVVYGLARRFGRDFFTRPAGRRLLPAPVLAHIEAQYRRHGAVGIFVSRLLPIWRAVVPPF